jgi:cytochrome P450
MRSPAAVPYNYDMTTMQQSLGEWGAFDQNNPHPLFHDVLQRGAVHAVTLADGHDAWLVVGYAEARAALNDPRISKDMQAALASGGGVVAEGLPGPAFARHMLAVDPPDHTRLRRLVAGAFSVRRIEGLRADAQRIVDKIASDRVVECLSNLVATKRRHPDDALVSALITARDGDERLSEQELLSTIFQLIIARHDTTSSLIGNGVVALLTHPEQLDRLRSDPALMANAVEELIRYDSPVRHATFRYALEPIELGDVTIPAGAQIIINLASAGRDPSHYSEPDALDIGRSDVRHLGFGHGIHFCLGAPLARMEGNIALGRLIRRFPELQLAVTRGELRRGHGDGLVLRGLTTLPVIPGRAAPRRSSAM